MPDERYHVNYVSFFERFNEQRFFEAHEVLEELWLPRRHASEGDFYKGLIQLAGAFVHVQRAHPDPAARLLRLARRNLDQYSPLHQGLAVGQAIMLIDAWLTRVTSPAVDWPLLTPGTVPRLGLA